MAAVDCARGASEPMDDLAACLPPELHDAAIERISVGLSGAGVYRVDAGARGSFVLKISEQPLKREIIELASNAGIAPRVIHVDADRNAFVSELVIDRGFMARVMTPATRALAIDELARTLRRVHDLPIPEGAVTRAPRELLAMVWQGFLAARFAVPGFAADAIMRMLDEPVPASDRAIALCHNDINPTNVVYDGERVVLIDWDTAGPNDPLIDLAAASVFLRLDDAGSRALLAAHDGAPVIGELPARFAYCRRLVATAVGTIFLHLARAVGHAGSSDGEPLTMTECFEAMRAGRLDLTAAGGRWTFGLALIAHGRAL
ncbi:MAG TPA: phosphotransferase [Kofleriaceae bacterium]|jgi:thiamine kinase-like enzyme